MRNTLQSVMSSVSMVCRGSRPFVTTFSVAFEVYVGVVSVTVLQAQKGPRQFGWVTATLNSLLAMLQLTTSWRKNGALGVNCRVSV